MLKKIIRKIEQPLESTDYNELTIQNEIQTKNTSL